MNISMSKLTSNSCSFNLAPEQQQSKLSPPLRPQTPTLKRQTKLTMVSPLRLFLPASSASLWALPLRPGLPLSSAQSWGVRHFKLGLSCWLEAAWGLHWPVWSQSSHLCLSLCASPRSLVKLFQQQTAPRLFWPLPGRRSTPVTWLLFFFFFSSPSPRSGVPAVLWRDSFLRVCVAVLPPCQI